MGNTYVADYQNQTIRKIAPNGAVTTLAGSPGLGGSADGTGSAARFTYPYAVAVDSAGTVYVADTFNYLIRAITPTGTVTTLAGSAGMSGTADGTGAAARLNAPEAIAVDTAGNLYVADGRLRKVTTPGGVVTTLAGTPGVPGSTDGIGAAALFTVLKAWQPTATAISSSQTTGRAPSQGHRGRRGDDTGRSPFTYGSADGTGAAAQFFTRAVLREISRATCMSPMPATTESQMDPARVVTTVVGIAGSQGVALEALPASLNAPWGVAMLPGPQLSLVISSTAGERHPARTSLIRLCPTLDFAPVPGRTRRCTVGRRTRRQDYGRSGSARAAARPPRHARPEDPGPAAPTPGSGARRGTRIEARGSP